ncbi:type III PLP-dependent enzyme domain-containing protein [Clostridium perfringens]|uniref:pyridoxal-dependent decarboxylase n=1 Tax=Clostridium perfringens TaxID=1502 RepID=UPI000D919647|nr:pyridoxal-dependent decarboxylase [Clostridium perfringens]MCC2766115.1 pyridoxal-dependent decarboxylase [Clostridium perfringens]MCG4543359.1 pyridoxal-dependent decarboxylase [Clostridium perfringens]MCG4553960.1 pyridoxal-dependent decarboxylase [Clostridium perfringens]MCG4557705.1 pyridoxal-dependent decarboxylase [Clostridium perfringens]MCG4560753.1 pyridoxal-dependent decarboxylase [Clostridium perfringens]
MISNLKTPCFIINENELKKNIDNMHSSLRKTWGNYIIGYSYKTNSLPWIINYLKENSVYAEVVSDLEYNLAKKINYDSKRIIFNGPNKGKKTFINALKEGAIINIDSSREIDWLSDEEFNKDIKVGIRVNFDLEKECPNETAMGLDGGRFGFSLENGSFNKAVKRINNIKNVKVVGIHLHNSTKTRSLKIYKTLAKKANEIADMFDYELEYIDIGGGFFGGLETKPSYYEYMKTIADELSKKFDKNKTKLIVEPGASIIASPISFLCEVIDVKDTYAKRIVTVNGSRNNIDPLMRKESYFLDLLIEKERKSIKEQIICGYTCMENDRLLAIRDNNELLVGDKLLFNKVGSYTMCLSPLFIEYFPIVYLENDKSEFICVREKWTVDEYMQKSTI